MRTAVEGLKADGVPVGAGKPAAVADQDVVDATHIFAIGCLNELAGGAVA